MNRRWIATATLAALSLTATACTAGRTPSGSAPINGSTARPTSPLKLALVAYDTCDALLANLRRATAAVVGPYGLPGGFGIAEDGFMVDKRVAAPTAAGANATPAYSGTNNQESGVDEPDIVKTDGHRIVALAGGALRVVDAATRKVTGTLALPNGGYQMLVDGDRALVIGSGYMTPSRNFGPLTPYASGGPLFTLVDLSGAPKIVATYRIDGGYIAAREVGDRVSVVIGSQPRLVFPYEQKKTDAQRVATNRGIIAHAKLDAWLPRITVTQGGRTQTSSVPCGQVSHPASYTGTDMLTVLTFDLSAPALGDGSPMSVLADGNTVYATQDSLYVAVDQRWNSYGFLGDFPGAIGGKVISPSSPPVDPGTTIYRFDTSGAGRPTYVGDGNVPGYLVNQYAMSEWNNVLRVATTTGTSWSIADGKPAGAQTSESAVYTLSTAGPQLKVLGRVGGLGVKERIYSVRFEGPVGYVVTFRQVDPLYTLDLSDPKLPTLRGELKITGYSSYLHPTSANRLIGIGQSADAVGHVGGTQVSLFDVSDLANPKRLGGVAFPNGNSTAEYDPHAFLYWPATGLVVAPLDTWTNYNTTSGVMLLRVTDDGITELGMLNQPATTPDKFLGPISRSLMIGDTLWTLSDRGLMATDTNNLRQLAWLQFS